MVRQKEPRPGKRGADSIRFGSVRFGSVRFDSFQLNPSRTNPSGACAAWGGQLGLGTRRFVVATHSEPSLIPTIVRPIAGVNSA